MPYDALGNYIEGDDVQYEGGSADPFAAAAEYMKKKAALAGAVVKALPKMNTAATAAAINTAGQVAGVPSDAKDDVRKAAIVNETPLRVPTAIVEGADLPVRVLDAIRQPDYVSEEPKDGQYGPNVRKVGALEAFGQAQYGTLSATDVNDKTRAYLREEVAKDPSLVQDQTRLTKLRDDFVKTLQPTQRRLVGEANDAISDFAGAPRDADKTQSEKLLQTGIMATMPVPTFLPGKAGNVISELTMPGVNAKNYGAGAVAINTGASVGTQAIIDHLMQPTAEDVKGPEPKDIAPGHVELPTVDFTSGMPIIAQQQYEDHTTEQEKIAQTHAESPLLTPAQAMPLFVGLATLFNPRAAARAAGAVSAPSSVDVLKGLAQKTPNVSPPAAELPKTGFLARHMDEGASLERMMKNAGVDSQEAIDTINKAYTYANAGVHQDLAHWERAGELPASTIRTMPKEEINKFDTWLKDNDLRDAFNTGILAKTELRTRQRYLDKLSADNQLYSRMLQSAQQRNDTRAIKEYTKSLNETQKNMADLLNDTKVPGMSHMSWEDLETAVQNFDNVAEFKAFHDKIVQDNYKWLNYAKDEGLISDDSFVKMSEEAPYYIPRLKDPYDGKKGVARAQAKVKNWLTSQFEDPHGDDFQEKVYTHSETPYAAREFDNGEGRVEAPMYWADALHTRAEHTIRHAQYQRFIRTVVNDLRAKAGARADDVMETLNYNGNLKTRNQWSALFSADEKLAARIDNEKWIPVSRGNEVEYVKFKDPLAHAAALLPPTMTGPIIKAIQKMGQPFRELTTGKLSGFQPVSMLFDTATVGVTRPRGSVYGIDYAAMKGISLVNNFGAKFGLNPIDFDGHFATALKEGGRFLDNFTAYGPTYVMNLGTALQTFAKTYGNHVATALAGDLTANSPLFEALGKTSPQFVQRMSYNIMDKYKDSLYSLATDSHVAQDYHYRRMRRNMKEMDRLLDHVAPRSLRLAGQLIGGLPSEAWNIYRHAISSIESAARLGYVMRNVELEAMKYGGDWRQIPAAKLQRILRDGRTLSGDFHRRPGRKLQKISAVVPYSNVMMKTSRALASRLWDHANPKTVAYMTGIALTGAILPRLQSDLFMTQSNDYLRDWWYNKIPDWQREQLIMMPKPHAYAALMSRNVDAINALTEKDFWRWMGMPEVRPIASAVSETMRALGAYNDHGNVSKPHHPFTAIGLAAGQAFAPVMTPVINALMEAGGAKVDIGKMFAAESPFDMTAGGSGRSGAYDMLNVTSSIPTWLGNAVATVFGPGGSRLLQTFDTGVQVYEKNGQHYLDALAGATDEFIGSTRKTYGRFDTPGLAEVDAALQKGLGVGIPFVGAAADKVYRRTSASDTVKAIRDITSLVSGRNNTFGKEGTGDMLLDDIVSDIRAMSRDPEYKSLSEDWRETNNAIARNDADKLTKYEQRNATRIQLTKKLQDITTKQAALLQELQEDMRKDWGKQYAVKYGTEFTWKDFAQRIGEAKRKMMAKGE